MTSDAVRHTPRVLIPEVDISWRRRELAVEISRDYEGRDLVLVCILQGSMVFFVDLARDIPNPLRFDYVGVTSYGDGTTSSGQPQIRADLSRSIEGKHVLLVEDIVDTGITASFLLERFAGRDPASLKLAALLDKPARRQIDVDIDYLGFTIPDEFVVGYGLDYAQLWRNLPYIGVLDGVV